MPKIKPCMDVRDFGAGKRFAWISVTRRMQRAPLHSDRSRLHREGARPGVIPGMLL